MLPEPYRLHHRADFSRAVRRGQRIGRRDLVVHAFTHGYDQGSGTSAATGSEPAQSLPAEPAVRIGGPRFGLIVSKAVGNSVIRHRVARRLRHICAQVQPELPAEIDIVIRALPSSAAAGSDDLLRQLRAALRRLGATERAGSPS
ncbi:ribonuclease P protein component [Nocardia sp. NPDC057227]|uniref:ribonuclease P protein component n=1 Tax=Nocardia sp. NPDC057227 TaxID=3346056 RepID=UPI0036319102